MELLDALIWATSFCIIWCKCIVMGKNYNSYPSNVHFFRKIRYLASRSTQRDNVPDWKSCPRRVWRHAEKLGLISPVWKLSIRSEKNAFKKLSVNLKDTVAYKSRFLNKGFVLYHLQVCKVRIYNTLITVSYLISAQLVTKVQYVVKKNDQA